MPPLEVPRATWNAALKHGVHEKESVQPKGTKVVLGPVNSGLLREGVVFARLLCGSVETLERLHNFHVPNKQELFELASDYHSRIADAEERWKLLSRGLRSFGVRVDSGRRHLLVDGDSFEIASLLLEVLKAVAQIDIDIQARAADAAKKAKGRSEPANRRRRRDKIRRNRRGLMSEHRQRSLPQIAGRRKVDAHFIQQSQSYTDLHPKRKPEVIPGGAWRREQGHGGGTLGARLTVFSFHGAVRTHCQNTCR